MFSKVNKRPVFDAASLPSFYHNYFAQRSPSKALASLKKPSLAVALLDVEF